VVLYESKKDLRADAAPDEVRTAPVPDTLDEALSPGWLTAVLVPRFPGARVTLVARGPVISRVSTNARFSIECEDGLPEVLPRERLHARALIDDRGHRFGRCSHRERGASGAATTSAPSPA
jgi:hypothetical protein